MARTELKHYYLHRLREPEFWTKLARGRLDVVAAMTGVASRVLTARSGPSAPYAAKVAFQDRMADGLRTFPGPVLLMLSGRDLTAKEFLEYTAADARWRRALAGANIEREDLPLADHTFSSAEWRGHVESCTLGWLARTLRASRP